MNMYNNIIDHYTNIENIAVITWSVKLLHSLLNCLKGFYTYWTVHSSEISAESSTALMTWDDRLPVTNIFYIPINTHHTCNRTPMGCLPQIVLEYLSRYFANPSTLRDSISAIPCSAKALKNPCWSHIITILSKFSIDEWMGPCDLS